MGRVLAVDPGTIRVGLAVSDALRITAQPLDVVPAGDAVDRIVAVSRELEIEEIVIGLPVTERGVEGASAQAARQLGEQIADATGLPVSTIDEKYTSRMAESAMIEGGISRRDRRANVDKVAAALILRTFLDSPRNRS